MNTNNNITKLQNRYIELKNLRQFYINLAQREPQLAQRKLTEINKQLDVVIADLAAASLAA